MTTSAAGGTNSPASFTNRNRVTGLASGKGGFDTQGIVDSLMAIERRPYDELDIKRQTEQLRLQAYQAVNTYLLNFRNSVGTLSSRSLWNAKMTTSTNEKSLTATANEYAIKGSYSFKVAQVAAATEYASKVVADPKAPLSPPKKVPDPENEGEMMDGPAEKIGEINLASAKTRVDNSVKLEQLNGGKGVFRGSIRITDSNNGSANIDLSAAVTLDDVVRKINEASGVRVNASMREGRLFIEDEAGGSSTLKIQNVGAGSTATDLGIAGGSKEITNPADGTTTKALHGRNVYTLGNDMALTQLNDGLGVEEGEFALRVYGEDSDGNDSYYELLINVDGAKTVGDVINRVNSEIQAAIEKGEKYPGGGGEPEKLLKNLRFGISSDGAGFGFTGVTKDHSYQFYDRNDASMTGQMTPAAQLGLTNDIQSAGVDPVTGQPVREVSFGRVLGDANSPMLKNLGGVDNMGVGNYPPDSRVSVPFNGSTKVSALNGGEGLNTSTGFNFILLEGGKDSDGIEITDEANIINDAVDMVAFREWLADNPDATVDDLLNRLNTEINDYAADPGNNAAGLRGFTIGVDPAGGNRLVISGVQAGYTMQIAGGLANSLGLTRVPMDGGDATIRLDPELDPEFRDAIDEFYGMGDYKKPLISGNGDIVLEGDPDADPPVDATTLGDLDEMLNGRSVEDLFGSGGFTIRVGSGTSDNGTPDDPSDDTILHDYTGNPDRSGVGDAMEITVDWADLKDEEGNALTLDEDTGVAAFVDAMNRAIKEKFADTVQADGTSKYGDGVPQVRLNSMADGLQWSNMDFTGASGNGQYWEMTDSGGGAALESMNLAKGVTRDLTSATHLESRINYDLKPMETGYIDTIELNADTADEVLVGDLYYGAAINLAGEPDDAFDITFKLNDAAEGEADNSRKVSFTLQQLKDALNAKVTDLAKTDIKSLTVEEYLGVMNDLVDAKIEDYYATEEPGVPAEERFSMDFAVGDNGTFVVENLENTAGLQFGGNVVGDRTGWNTGIAPYRYTQEQIDDLKEADKPIVVNQMPAGRMIPQEIEGLGEIQFTIDGDDAFGKIFTLKTDGLTQDSSLNDLLNKLNDQLAALAVDDGKAETVNELLKDMKFVLNDSGTGIALDNGSTARITFIQPFQLREDPPLGDADDPENRIPDAQRLAKDLGLVGVNGEPRTVEAYSFYNGKSLGRNYISRATSLEDFVGKNVMDMGSIRITNAGGNTAPPLDLNGMKTLGDLIDAINAMKFGVAAQINARGDGIDIFEGYEQGMDPPPEMRQGEIAVADSEGGPGLMKKLGLSGTGNRTDMGDGRSAILGSLTKTIEVMSTDSLNDIMFRISDLGYKTAIVNDGNGSYLSVSSSNTGEKYDFVIESDVEQLGFNQVKRGKDAKVLYGDPDSSGSPRMLSSETNSNSNAINGITLDIKSVSADWTTVTVEDDKEQVTEAVKTMVTSYNELSEIIKMLDAYDQETGEEGILFGDNNVRTLMDDINEFFYDVYNPNNVPLGKLDEDGKQQTWTWMDLGISLNAAPSNADGTGGWYNLIDLDEEALENMVSTNWDVMSKMLSNEQNIANTSGSETARPTGSFNGTLADGFSADGAINGDMSKTNFGKTNGIEGAKTIAEGDNAYTVWFQKSTHVNRMTVNFPSAEDALKDFTVEYLDSATGEWKQLRKGEGNMSDMVPYGFMTENIQADAIRLTATTTNAKDGKFRLSNLQIFEETGLAGKMNYHTNELGDTQFGFLASMNDEIQANLTDLEDQMFRLEEKLTAKEEALWRRFTAMETAMSKMQGQGDYFTNMMNSLGGGK